MIDKLLAMREVNVHRYRNLLRICSELFCVRFNDNYYKLLKINLNLTFARLQLYCSNK